MPVPGAPLNDKEDFIKACKPLVTQGILNEALVQRLEDWELLDSIPAEDIFKDIASPLEASDLSTLITNIERFCEDTLETEDQAIMTEMQAAIAAAQAKETNPSKLSLSSVGGIHCLLIEIMAASSKLGAGSEESAAILEGTPQLASKLAKESKWYGPLKNLAKLYKKNEALLLPYHFMFGVLLPKADLRNLASFPQNLSKDLAAFQRVQNKFGDCLTKCAQEAKQAFKAEFKEANADLFDLELDLSEEVIKKLGSILRETQSIIQHRVNYGLDSTHLNEAKNWLRDPLLVELAQEALAYPAAGTKQSLFAAPPKANQRGQVEEAKESVKENLRENANVKERIEIKKV